MKQITRLGIYNPAVNFFQLMSVLTMEQPENMDVNEMKKKVLIFSSSPRKGGNSDLLCDQFVKGAQEAGHNTEKVILKEKKINYCTGCGVCLNGEKRCPQKDDMAELLEKMITADVIVMATPVYFYTMSAQMKTLIDRVCSRYTEVSDKEFYFILAAADTNKQAMERTVEGFRGFTSCLNGPKEKGVILGTGAWKIGDIKKNDAMKQAYDMGKQV
jgi:multimeric flavodoxin WrbA